jgi:hypothetical protein
MCKFKNVRLEKKAELKKKRSKGRRTNDREI